MSLLPSSMKQNIIQYITWLSHFGIHYSKILYRGIDIINYICKIQKYTLWYILVKFQRV